MSLPENILKVRLLLGIKQDAVARTLGIKQSTYSKMETGMIKIGEEKLAEIANALGVNEEAIRDFDKHLLFIHNIKTKKWWEPAGAGQLLHLNERGGANPF